MTDDQIKYMVDRFLGWKLPENFNPDGGIRFEKAINKDRPSWPQKNEPVGTNLFDATQAEEMVRYMVAGLPVRTREVVEALRAMDSPTAWYDSEDHSCRFCDANNRGPIVHADDCVMNKLREALRNAEAGRQPDEKREVFERLYRAAKDAYHSRGRPRDLALALNRAGELIEKGRDVREVPGPDETTMHTDIVTQIADSKPSEERMGEKCPTCGALQRNTWYPAFGDRCYDPFHNAPSAIGEKGNG